MPLKIGTGLGSKVLPKSHSTISPTIGLYFTMPNPFHQKWHGPTDSPVFSAEQRHSSRQLFCLTLIQNTTIQVQFDLKCRKPLIVLSQHIMMTEKLDILVNCAAMHALASCTVFHILGRKCVAKMHIARVGHTLHTRFNERFQGAPQEKHVRGLKGHGIIAVLG